MKILVVDDESRTRECLRRLLAETDGDYELAGEAADARQAIACCRTQPIDLVLLDTQMPGMNGLEAARQLALLERPPTIILMSSEASSSPSQTQRRVAGHLFKPVRPEGLREALRLARALNQFGDAGTVPSVVAHPRAEQRQEISAWYRGGARTVAVRDIIYLRADQKYVNVRHLGGELLVDESLRSFESEFPDLFLRIHRNALVARPRLSGIEKLPDGTTQARLRDCGDRLPVSRRHLAAIRRWLRRDPGRNPSDG